MSSSETDGYLHQIEVLKSLVAAVAIKDKVEAEVIRPNIFQDLPEIVYGTSRRAQQDGYNPDDPTVLTGNMSQGYDLLHTAHAGLGVQMDLQPWIEWQRILADLRQEALLAKLGLRATGVTDPAGSDIILARQPGHGRISYGGYDASGVTINLAFPAQKRLDGGRGVAGQMFVDRVAVDTDHISHSLERLARTGIDLTDARAFVGPYAHPIPESDELVALRAQLAAAQFRELEANISDEEKHNREKETARLQDEVNRVATLYDFRALVPEGVEKQLINAGVSTEMASENTEKDPRYYSPFKPRATGANTQIIGIKAA